MTPLVDQVARDRIRRELDTTFFVEAAAGAGKTTELVERVLQLVRTGRARLSEIVAVTFTEKAAGEMKYRLRREIERQRTQGGAPRDERDRFRRALEELEVAHIGTIHGFCADILRERPVEAGVDPLFEVADDAVLDRLVEEAFQPFFLESLKSPPEGIRRVLRRRHRDRDAVGPYRALYDASRALIDVRDFGASWKRPPLDRAREMDRAVQSIVDLADLAPRAADRECWLTKSIEEVARFAGELARREAVRGRDYDGLEVELRDLTSKRFWDWKGGRTKYFSDDLTKDEVRERRQACRAYVKSLLDRVDADLAACLREELRPVAQAYETRKQRRGKLDFLDLLLLTRDLLRSNEAVRNELQRRFRYLLVDEFQDTDPLQAEILLLLGADDPKQTDLEKVRPAPGKLFFVGDPKQAIYRFRRADVALYSEIKERLASSRAAEVLELTTSFRSVPSIQSAINSTFAAKMQASAEGSQARYVPLSPVRMDPSAQPTVVALPVPKPYSEWGRGDMTKAAIEESYADTVGAFVQFLVEKSGWTVEEAGGRRVPLQPGHICLLFRRLQSFGQDITRPYVRALEARGIAHVLVGGRAFHEREEVVALTNLLGAVEWPEDEFHVFATLRGPFLGIGDDALLAYRHAFGTLNPFRPTADVPISEMTQPVVEALSILRRLHRARNRRPIADTVGEFLELVRAHVGVAIWPNGERALANLARLLDASRAFEAQGATSFRAFLRQLERENERGGMSDAPIVEEGVEGVRVLTVHKAKGLEFPVVILADPGAAGTSDRPSRLLDARHQRMAMPLCGCYPADLLEAQETIRRHDSEESVRLAYVATTRARDLLVLPVVGDPPHRLAGQSAHESWCDLFADAVYPAEGAHRSPELPAIGCPPFGRETVLVRPEGRWIETKKAIAPGMHRPRVGTHRVVWFDPSKLSLGAQFATGLRHHKILARGENDLFAASEGERIHREWHEGRERMLARGGVASRKIETVTERKDRSPVSPVPVILVELARAGGRPKGKRFGILVHAVLSSILLDADETQIRDSAILHGRMLGASGREVEAVPAVVKRVLQCELFERVRRAREVRREVPVDSVDDGVHLEGVVDLAFLESRGEDLVWTVVDFKTDEDLSVRRSEYENQVAWYACAVGAATKLPVEGVILHL